MVSEYILLSYQLCCSIAKACDEVGVLEDWKVDEYVSEARGCGGRKKSDVGRRTSDGVGGGGEQGTEMDRR